MNLCHRTEPPSSHRTLAILLLALLVATAAAAETGAAKAYTPAKGDTFSYSESITVNNGQGSYAGYNDQTHVTGTESMNSVSGSIVSASYSNSYQYSSNQGSSTASSQGGDFTWSASTYEYVNGTDNQIGYSRPVYIWFAMNPSIQVGGTFFVLNTQFTVMSRNYSFLLPTESSYVQTIFAEGTGQYQRNDSYGVFSASYTWDEYFDPSTGYIVAYHYVEQDTGEYQGQSGSFTYTDNLYVTSTSYTLTLASPATSVTSTETNGPSNLFTSGFLALALLIGLIVVGIAVYAATRGKQKEGALPEHATVPASPPPAAWESKVDLGSQPSQQVVIREVAKVNCRYCGTLIPTTADTCPYCGGPRR